MKVLFIHSYIDYGDYNQGSYYVNIPHGVTSFSFRILIHNDNITEGYETFNLQISSSSLPDNVHIGSRSRATVTIVDDDCKYFSSYNCMIHGFSYTSQHNRM